MLQATIALLCAASALAAEWTINLEYSVNDFKNTYPLGTIELRRNFEGNFTGNFKSSTDSQFGKKLLNALDETYSVRAVSSTQPGKTFITSNTPCNILQTRLFHLFWVSIDAEHRTLMSLAVYPDTVALSKEGATLRLSTETCSDALEQFIPSLADRAEGGVAKGVVHVNARGVLPSPDTQSFVQKMERERRARQQQGGGETDNRSFLAKYWMYIVPVVIFRADFERHDARTTGRRSCSININ
ncbi:unnamed protein product [Caenorhabditis auriculariae]|uniref:ER membrane protein complex subunit 10 n=1 Tax=Caenorhabditis auriculariae TaxID=2777116 RepID=A0A8S1H2G8_9PELO|nr:unnamed protein product [Caenorhabditis auriculariae]